MKRGTSDSLRESFTSEVPAPESWPRTPVLVSVVCPVYNEAEGIRGFADSLLEVLKNLGLKHEVIFVEDDSPDESLLALQKIHRAHPELVKVISLSRRFGHQASLAAGFHYARGDVVICMDSDMQHPPSLLPEMIYRWSLGYQLVYTRRGRQTGRSLAKETASRWFYKMMDAMTDIPFEEGTADFRLMDQVVVDALRRFGERDLFYRGLVNWIGFRRTVVEFEAGERLAGHSSYSWKRMLKLGIDGLFSFSLVPLRFSFLLGAILMLVFWVYGIATVVGYLSGFFDVAGYTTLVLIVLFTASLNLIFLGVVGEYVGRIHQQVKQRPLFLVAERWGYADASSSVEAPATGAQKVGSSQT